MSTAERHARIAAEIATYAVSPTSKRHLHAGLISRITAALASEAERADGKAKLAGEFAQVLRELRDEDGDIYGWNDRHSGECIVGMVIEDAKDWLHRYDLLDGDGAGTGEEKR